MKRSLVWVVAIVPILSHGRIGSVQTGIPCYYDWPQLAAPETSATPEPVKWQKTLLRSPEFKDIVDRCRRQQSETVRWEDHVRALEAAVGDFAGPARTGVLGLIEMLRKERDHLRAAASAPAPGTRSAPPGDSNVRHFDLGPMLTEPVRHPDRLTVAPEFRSWVPQFLRDRIGNVFRTYGRIVQFEGEATIRRGDSTVRVSALLQRGNTWTLRPGDVFEVQRGRLVLEYDGKRYDLRQGTKAALDLDEQCMTQTKHGSGGRQRVSGTPVYLIEGTILYMTTTTEVRQACVITTPEVTVSIRGTAFTATHTPTANSRTLEVSVSNGYVSFDEISTTRTWTFGPGERHTFNFVTPEVLATASPTHHTWNVQNNCNAAVSFRLFEFNSEGLRVGAWPTQTIQARTTVSIPVAPKYGHTVCYGAGAEPNLLWGVNLDGNDRCDNCCRETKLPSETRTVRLSC